MTTTQIEILSVRPSTIIADMVAIDATVRVNGIGGIATMLSAGGGWSMWSCWLDLALEGRFDRNTQAALADAVNLAALEQGLTP